MPELPEVETIRRGLEKKIVGLTIKNLQVFYPKGVQFNPELVEGKKVVGVWRRAKMLGIDLSLRGEKTTKQSNSKDRHAESTLRLLRSARNDTEVIAMTLLFHLKMTGQLIYVASNEQREARLIGGHPTPDMRGDLPNKSTVAVFEFSNGSKLYFNDQRRFGWIRLNSKFEIRNSKLLQKLGPEPFDPKFTWEILKVNLLKHKSMPIKVAIMDQSVLSGIGNIYASESLFLAKIDPRRKVNSLSDTEFKKLYQGIADSLKLAIEKGGSTRANFVNVDGERGYFLDYANVYGKEGYPCTGCKGKVEKITQAGRGTYMCPTCQK
ncbi:MAG: bifunctional DNA-formamidopyrimidine glycosylase/DNA-(apurinic or apyrimidinic site) lyase [Candidatus Daviesbacteria bacterium]|nr:bifunctional DNA-formamidopyrimidine glycosylase/DNA-(apurinic or apyrimidinic site) lyase [Candidatus Daviesbacteria bacterium]